MCQLKINDSGFHREPVKLFKSLIPTARFSFRKHKTASCRSAAKSLLMIGPGVPTNDKVMTGGTTSNPPYSAWETGIKRLFSLWCYCYILLPAPALLLHVSRICVLMTSLVWASGCHCKPILAAYSNRQESPDPRLIISHAIYFSSLQFTSSVWLTDDWLSISYLPLASPFGVVTICSPLQFDLWLGLLTLLLFHPLDLLSLPDPLVLTHGRRLSTLLCLHCWRTLLPLRTTTWGSYWFPVGSLAVNRMMYDLQIKLYKDKIRSSVLIVFNIKLIITMRVLGVLF